MVRLQLSDERGCSTVTAKAKLGGYFHTELSAQYVCVVEDPLVLFHTWVLGNAVHEEGKRALYVQ
jgi:hypothetical protein